MKKKVDAGAVSMRGGRLSARTNRYAYLFVAPFFISLLLFSVIPNLFTFVISFTKWNSYRDMTFLGLENYRKILQNSLFYQSLYNNLKLMALVLPVSILLALVLAVVLDGKLLKCTQVFKTILFLPYITTPVALGVLFSVLFDYQSGTVNAFLQKLGILSQPIYWMASPTHVTVIVALILIWKNVGYNMLLFIAGLKTIPRTLYEAAEIDGANAFQRFRKITIPSLRPIMLFIIITSIIWGLQIFDEPCMLMVGTNSSVSLATTLGGPKKCVYTLVSYVYEEGFILFREGRAAAVAYLMSFIIMLFSVLSTKIMNRGGEKL